MRLANVLRRVTPFNVPARAGIPPTWDRPDPPESIKTPRTKRLTLEETHFAFHDASSPTFMLVNSEIALGTPGQAFPLILKNLSFLLVAGFIVGTIGSLWSSRPDILVLQNYSGKVERLQAQKSNFDNKYGLKDLQNNPWKLNVWPESFPIRNYGKQGLSRSYESRQTSINLIRQINKEGLAYWNRLYAQSEQALKKGGEAHH